MSQRCSHNQFVSQVLSVDANIEILSEYTTQKHRVLYRCNKCGTTGNKLAMSLLRGKYLKFGICENCREIPFTPRLTPPQFIEKVAKKNKKITLIDTDYTIASRKYSVSCNYCFKGFKLTAIGILQGNGCSECSHARTRMSHMDFKNKLDKLSNSSIIMIDDYVTNRIKILVECRHCSHRWKASPQNLGQGHGCTQCNGGGFNNDNPAILYYVSVNDGEAYKIGITNRSVDKRFAGTDLKKIKALMVKKYHTGREAREEETRILHKYSCNKWDGLSLLSDGNSEMFNIDILGLDNDKNKN